jgi:cysteine-rich repeat protein
MHLIGKKAGAVTIAALLATPWLLATRPSPAEARPAPCPGGHYLIAAAPRSSRGPMLASGAVTLDGRTVSLSTGCSGAVRMRHAKGGRLGAGGTRVLATLSSCASVGGKVRFKAGIDGTCRSMWGSIATRKGRSHFEAELSLCGNGMIDDDEECDGSPCAGGAGCDACRCDLGPIPGPGCTPGVDPGCASGGAGSTTTTTTTLVDGGGSTTSTTSGGVGTTITSTTLSPTTTTLPRDPFKCYKLRESGAGRFQPGPLNLVDQFGSASTVVHGAERLCNPVDEDGAGVSDPTAHLMCYDLAGEPGFVRRSVVIRNRFGDQTLTLVRPDSLCVPAETDGVQSTLDLDRFKCYRVAQQRGEKFSPRGEMLADQFETRATTVQKPVLFCNPVDANGEGNADAENHLTCYRIPAPLDFVPRDVSVEDEFTVQQVRAFRGTCRKVALLCVPSLENPGGGTTTTTFPETPTTSSTSTSSTTSSTGPGGASTTSTSSTSTVTSPVPSTTSSSIVGGCGNGMVDGNEECDDGNSDPNDGCTNSCTICGNENVTAPETCDDGNTQVDDNCPEDCQIGACTPTAEAVQTITIIASRPDLTSIRFLLDYPDGQVALAGGPGPDLPPGTITDTPIQPTPFDLEHAVRVVVAADFTFDTTTIAKVNFLGCTGQPVPSASDYRCIVIDASDASFNNVAGVTCAVSTGESTTTTSSTSTTSSAPAATSSSTTTTASTTITTTSVASSTTLPTPSTTTTSSSSTTSTTAPSGIQCSANGIDVTVGLDYPLQTVGGVSAILLKTSYAPPLGIPGTGSESSVRARVTNLAGTSSSLSVSDKDTNADTVDDLFQATARKTQGSLDPGPVFKVRFDCPAGTNVSPASFPCTQEQSTDLSGLPFVPELAALIKCAVTLSAP